VQVREEAIEKRKTILSRITRRKSDGKSIERQRNLNKELNLKKIAEAETKSTIKVKGKEQLLFLRQCAMLTGGHIEEENGTGLGN
jgi:hypothetical protein